MQADHAHVEQLSRRLLEGITQRLDGVQLNGDAHARYPGNVNLSFAYVEGESLLMGLKVCCTMAHVLHLSFVFFMFPTTHMCVSPWTGSGSEQWQCMHQRLIGALIRVACIGCG